MADDRHPGLSGRSVILRRKSPTQAGNGTERAEEIGGHQLDGIRTGLLSDLNRRMNFGIGKELGKGAALFLVITTNGKRNPLARIIAGSVRENDSHQLLCVLHLQRSEQKLVDQTEDGGVRPDAQREREHGHSGEAGVLQQLAEGEFEIIHGFGGATSNVQRSTFNFQVGRPAVIRR